MKSSLTVIAIAGIVATWVGVMVLPVGVAHAQWDNLSWAVCATDEPVSLPLRPDGNGRPFTSAYMWNGVQVDATITVYCVDYNMDPIPDYPAEEIWLEWYGDEVVFCLGGNIADGPTDENGVTTFTGSPPAGGSGDAAAGYGLQIMMSGAPLVQPPFDISANSPDLTGDLVVNISDIAIFTQIFFGAYEYRADFFWDGIINLSDLAIFGQALGSECP